VITVPISWKKAIVSEAGGAGICLICGKIGYVYKFPHGLPHHVIGGEIYLHHKETCILGMLLTKTGHLKRKSQRRELPNV